MSESIQVPQVYWLFKPTPGGLARLGIQVFPDGDYWVHDAPTGTYAAGHSDKGKWRTVYEQYLAEGYISEHEAKQTGLVPQSWALELPSAPWTRQTKSRRLWAAAAFLALLVTSGMLAWLSR